VAAVRAARERVGPARVFEATGTRLDMHVSTAQEAILERIGQTLVDETIGPLPEAMVVLLDQFPTHRSDATNILCNLIAALTNPDLYRFSKRNGELFLEPLHTTLPSAPAEIHVRAQPNYPRRVSRAPPRARCRAVR
jgi:hypothetical protein